jgi:uncharacterized protein GlcG (DUF336 family)
LTFSLLACGGGESPTDPAAPPLNTDCSGSCASAATFLSVTDVEQVIAQAVTEAQARGVPATIAIVDRVGNVLGVFAMNGVSPTVRIASGRQPNVPDGLEQVNIVPSSLAAIAKAQTGAFLSTEGNAFSTRTASQIIQEHFNPRELLAPSGPLFGVQFSQLPCSDLLNRFTGGGAGPGPARSPLGLAADAGGFPLYKSGTVVGGVGIAADGRYGLDLDISDRDEDTDEAIAVAAAFGFAAPQDRRADRITADGKTLRFSDADTSDLVSAPRMAPPFATLLGTAGSLVAVPGYTSAAIRSGTAFGTTASGVRADSLDFPGLDAFVLVDAAGNERFRPRAGTELAGALSAQESTELLRAALRVANRTRAQIRRPLGTPARVTISLVDSHGVVLGIVRSRDAPVFGVDVSLQKARTAAFFSRADAAIRLAALPDAVFLDGALTVRQRRAPGQYVVDLRTFLGLPNGLADGQIAFTARAIGNLARPFYPDGVNGSAPGPLSAAVTRWSPFATGLQLDLVHNALIQHIGFVLGLAPDVPQNCTGVGGFDTGFVNSGAIAGLANGMQIFPGSVPIYRGRQLVGAIGVSGDGVDQDDLISFLAVVEARLAGVGHAPADLRSDRLAPAGVRLRYVGCPQAPFIDTDQSGVCDGF